jgi:hypothetical protein
VPGRRSSGSVGCRLALRIVRVYGDGLSDSFEPAGDRPSDLFGTVFPHEVETCQSTRFWLGKSGFIVRLKGSAEVGVGRSMHCQYAGQLADVR